MNDKEMLKKMIDKELTDLGVNLHPSHVYDREVVYDCFKKVFHILNYMRELDEV